MPRGRLCPQGTGPPVRPQAGTHSRPQSPGTQLGLVEWVGRGLWVSRGWQNGPQGAPHPQSTAQSPRDKRPPGWHLSVCHLISQQDAVSPADCRPSPGSPQGRVMRPQGPIAPLPSGETRGDLPGFSPAPPAPRKVACAHRWKRTFSCPDGPPWLWLSSTLPAEATTRGHMGPSDPQMPPAADRPLLRRPGRGLRQMEEEALSPHPTPPGSCLG